jgi:hypothetical protein
MVSGKGNEARAASRVPVSSHQVILFVSGIVGFVPAVAVLFHALRTYDYPHTEHAFFDTSRVFLAFGVGIVVGTISGAFTVALGVLSIFSLVIALLLVALFEEGLKLVYLNRKGYRGRFDSTFCGVSMGIGLAALVAAGNAYVNRQALLAPVPLAFLSALSASLALVHASTGAIIGLGCSKGDVASRFAQAYVARVLHSAMLVPFIVSSAFGADVVVPVFSLLAALVFALFVYVHVYRVVLPDTLPPELRRERRRDLRRPRDDQTVR